MENPDIRYFYRNIVKSGDKYRIKHHNKDYGEFKKLSDALYERDCLFYCKFDYDLLVECDIPNKYENMDLPPFPEKRPRGIIKGMTFNKKEMEGEIIFNHKELKFCIVRAGEVFGKYNTLVEAYYYKKMLMENDWDPSVLVQTKAPQEKIFVNKKVKASKPEIHFKFCPQCGNKVNEDDEICPICGIKLHEK